MPRGHPRHTITETGAIADAFAAVRAVGEEPDPKRLVVLGAEKLVEEHRRRADDDRRRAALRERLIHRTTRPDGVDTGAALWAHEEAWRRGLPDD